MANCSRQPWRKGEQQEAHWGCYRSANPASRPTSHIHIRPKLHLMMGMGRPRASESAQEGILKQRLNTTNRGVLVTAPITETR